MFQWSAHFFQTHYLEMLFLLRVLAFKMPPGFIFLLKQSAHIFRQVYSVYELKAVNHILNMTLLSGCLRSEVYLNISIPKTVVRNTQLHYFSMIHFQKIPAKEHSFCCFKHNTES